MNTTLLDTLQGKQAAHTPVWLMRQAGRYLPEYRKLREQAGSFLNLCKNPELACQATLQPLQRFDLDAAIMFSDILVIPDAMGLGLYFSEGEGPKFSQPLLTPAAIDNLAELNVKHELGYVLENIQNIQSELKGKLPLIGFSGSPFTLACYMLEGGSSSNYLQVKRWLYQNPEYLHKLLDKLTVAVINYLNAQIEAGVNVVMLFDSWGGMLTAAAYQEFSLFYLAKVVAGLHKQWQGKVIPNIVFTKGGGAWLKQMQQQLSSSALGIDWSMDLAQARQVVGSKVILQGNCDPALLSVANQATIEAEVERILSSYAAVNNGLAGHVFNLGHGILPSANIDNVNYLIEAVHSISRN